MASIGNIYLTSVSHDTKMGIMEKELATAAGVGPAGQQQTSAAEAKCPVAHGGPRPQTNAGWWPNQLNLQVLHQHSTLSDPMGEAFDYSKEFQSLDLNALIKDLHALMT